MQPRAWRRTTLPGDPAEVPDRLERDFAAAAPGDRLVGDITYLHTAQGWLYLAVVLDLATRMVVGWQIAEHMRTSLVTDALAMAAGNGFVRPGSVFHSDRGAQGGFKRSSQHLHGEELRWDVRQGGSQRGRAERRCRHRGAHQCRPVSSVVASER